MRTIILQESGDFKDISHFFHFMELLFIAIIEIRNRGWEPGSISNISIPHWPQKSWKGKEQPHNEWTLNRIFPNSVVIHTPVYGTDVITIDRAAYDCGSINKTWAKYIKSFDPYHWTRLVKTPLPEIHMGKPVITYINRQNSRQRRLSPSVHTKVLKLFENNLKVIFNNVHMEDISFDNQVEIMNNTDLLIGVHGNGLTHAAFMKPHSSVCEIFVPGTQFQWDYYTLSKMMGHEYVCIFNGSPALPFMFNKSRPVCTSDDFDPEIINGMIDQIKEEKIN